LPSSKHEITSGSRQTMIPENIDDSFAALLEDKQLFLKMTKMKELARMNDKPVTNI